MNQSDSFLVWDGRRTICWSIGSISYMSVYSRSRWNDCSVFWVYSRSMLPLVLSTSHRQTIVRVWIARPPIKFEFKFDWLKMRLYGPSNWFGFLHTFVIFVVGCPWFLAYYILVDPKSVHLWNWINFEVGIVHITIFNGMITILGYWILVQNGVLPEPVEEKKQW